MHVVAELFPTRKRQDIELPERATGLDLFEALHLAPDAHLLIRGGAPIPVDEILTEGEGLRILAVVSGGVR